MLDFTLLKTLLPDAAMRLFDEIDSTNNEALAWIKEGGRPGGLVMAERQSGGKGRKGRSFCSLPGGLYMSVLLPGGRSAGELTTLCAVAVCHAVSQLTGLQLAVKWVNDLLYEGKKVCGILCEGVWAGEENLGTVAGIGLNVCQTFFPPELAPVARSLYPDGNIPAPLEQFAAAIYHELFRLLPDTPAHMAEYRSRCVTLQKRVCWKQEGILRDGVACDVDNGGALLIETPDGMISLGAGEVSVRPF